MPRDLASIDDLTPDERNANLGTERGRYKHAFAADADAND